MAGFQDFEEQGAFVSRIHERIRQRSLPHALLITGEKGVGKKSFADLIAAALLCQEPSSAPCGHCASCRLIEAGTHPDLILIQKGVPIAQKEDKSKSVIPVADIEELENRCSEHPYTGERRVIIIKSADDMNPQAQNKLLKKLEDPPAGTFFILTSEKKEQLLPTIISRCLCVYFHPWQQDTVIRILVERGVPGKKARTAAEESGGSIGEALKLTEDDLFWTARNEICQSFFHLESRGMILTVSNQWKEKKGEAETLFSVLEAGILRLLDFRLHGERNISEQELSELYGPAWVRVAKECELSAFSALLDGMMLSRKRVQASMNFQVIVEQVLLMLMEAKSKWSM